MQYLSANGKSIDGEVFVSDLSGASGVYALVNTQNFKMYIGISNDLNRRIQEHLSNLCENKHINKHLQYSFDKHDGNFLVFVLHVDYKIDYDDLREKEKFYISHYETFNREFGYNLTQGGDGTLGYTHSEETRIKMSKNRTGLKHSLKTKKNLSEIAKARGISEITRQRSIEEVSISIVQVTFKGEVFYWKNSHEASRSLDISDSQIRRCCNTDKVDILPSFHRSFWFDLSDFESPKFKMPIRALNSNPVAQLTLDGEFVREWDNASEVETVNFNRDPVGLCCRGLKESYKGFKWMYLFDYNPSLLDISILKNKININGGYKRWQFKI